MLVILYLNFKISICIPSELDVIKKKPTTNVCSCRGRDHMVVGATATCAVSA